MESVMRRRTKVEVNCYNGGTNTDEEIQLCVESGMDSCEAPDLHSLSLVSSVGGDA